MKEASDLKIFTDGGARGNPGPAAVGIVVKGENGKTIFEDKKTIGKATNNVAEYQAVLHALFWLENFLKSGENFSAINFFLDSLLVVNQLNGLFKIKDAKLRNLILEVRKRERILDKNIHYNFIPRSENFRADWLVNKALDEKSL